MGIATNRKLAVVTGASSGIGLEAVQADLHTRDGVEVLARAIDAGGRPVDALLLNAGVGVGGRFIETSLDDELDMVALNQARLGPALI